MNHAANHRQPRFHRNRRQSGPGNHPIQIEGPDFLNPRAVLHIGWEPATANATE
jgi:hypothetical protein